MVHHAWVKASLIYLLIIGVIGCVLRSMAFIPTPFNYKYLLHAHSHAAFLGWIFLSLTALIFPACIAEENLKSKSFNRQFLLFNISNIGMLLSFPLQGYGAISIAFSTLHIFTSYWLIYSFFKNGRTYVLLKERAISFLFICAAFVFFLISTIAPFALGPVMVSKWKYTPLYNNLVYFYLHFQYNGWLTFAVLGLFFWFLERNKISFSKRSSAYFLALLFIAAFPSYFLSMLWSRPGNYVFYIGMAGGIVQLGAVMVFLWSIWPVRKAIKNILNPFSCFLLLFSILAFILKIILQSFSGIPYFAELFYQIRNFIISYLHMVLIGFVSFFILSFHIQLGSIKLSRRLSRAGIMLFISGFILSELLLLKNAISSWLGYPEFGAYNQMLLGVSTLMPAGILFLLPEQFLKPART